MTESESKKHVDKDKKEVGNSGAHKSSKFNRRKRKDRQLPRKKRIEKSANKFKGIESKMRGFVFQCHQKASSSTQFAKMGDKLQRYTSTTYQSGGDINNIIRTRKDTVLPMPRKPIVMNQEGTMATPDAAMENILLEIWKIEIKQHCERKSRYIENKKVMFTEIWGQCSTNMQTKIRSLVKWEEINNNQDILRLLKEVSGVAFRYALILFRFVQVQICSDFNLEQRMYINIL